MSTTGRSGTSATGMSDALGSTVSGRCPRCLPVRPWHGMLLLVALAAPWGGVCLSCFVSTLDGLCRAWPFALPYFLFSISYVGRTSGVLSCRIFCFLLFTYWIAYMGRGLCTFICLDASP